MDLDQVEERIKKLEENIAKFEEQELRNIENIKNEIKLLDTHVSEMNKKKNSKKLLHANKCFAQKLLQKKENCNKKKKYMKDIKRDVLFQIKLVKDENNAKKKNENLLHKHFNFQHLKEFTDQVKQNFLMLNVRREYSIKSIFEEISKIKNKSIAYLNKFLIIQKEINSLLQTINNNALTDIFVLAKNSLLFQKEVANMFQRFYHQVENSITGL
ncbi:conserved Plasmodium protein, unknown function [Plasmodium knowlesi strain H]|uniref:Uncharacterized protein n=3 Tax=Plasmodium knowlesi TaxID=5850 RepID=A0A5K1TUG5_PLAKH|nr:conserved Plasmodium protein, unknown function [Plasmodium knowlesi strain H]OTN67820.1 Uncharacterized protein PKNOH_S05382400 [Plasmodium knowlesi]CAA9990415.1 conserved Plasmodium protein, unknown function [Plasmodium knowlesi strain H]SBO19621.1 conserved Plasmodium protein, unknown function [Plasmodium knowlesi strain H]SBO22589.1 conserved Plasmodium protein, unknown function [Plasmodium knowlesi strain H]VVS79889.1 conserved Plasmodium protein, unknown function [Plasmodium knowlesi s|eukprot:XP_002260815.1 hypothetical protein, conserved in Plasmodium species [Plasmodium knowlesi strain H]